VFNVEDADVISCGYDGAVVGVGHELDRENIAPMACQYRGSKIELRRGRFWMVGVDVDAVVV
jgi:deoxycytidylate deaminase